ncbi:MAG: AmmeMemoRadiSam system protein A [Phycisphaerae bacterium]
MAIPNEQRTELLRLARKAVEAEVNGEPLPSDENPTGVLAEQRGVFVTLTNAGRLRGCIGTFRPTTPLAETVVEMASAATRDPRFTADPITPQELDRLTVQISVLSPLEKTDHPEQLEVGKHGIYVVRGMRSGCFLPEVATEMCWSAEEFLSYCCATKAGLPADAWQNKDTEVYLFTTEKFSDKDIS